jgi:hypothetical protein
LRIIISKTCKGDSEVTKIYEPKNKMREYPVFGIEKFIEPE